MSFYVLLCFTCCLWPAYGGNTGGGGIDIADLLAGMGGGNDGINWGEILGAADWGKLVGAALQGAAHKHSEDPEEEDVASHFQHVAATQMFTMWLQSLWQQVPEEWARPVEEVAKMFQGFQDSPAQAEALFTSLQNPSFRRQWIRALSGLAANWIKHLAQPHVQSEYLKKFAKTVGGMVGGQVDQELLNPHRPFEESLSMTIDTVLNTQYSLGINSSTYVGPIIRYITELIQLGQGSVSKMTANELDDRLAQTLNSEVIETVLRVWRAHKYSMVHPQCDRQLICELNNPSNIGKSTQNLKPGVTKLASIVSAWYLSGHTGTPFLELYSAATENYNCRVTYPADCSSFHEDDVRITTEYYHNEL